MASHLRPPQLHTTSAPTPSKTACLFADLNAAAESNRTSLPVTLRTPAGPSSSPNDAALSESSWLTNPRIARLLESSFQALSFSQDNFVQNEKSTELAYGCKRSNTSRNAVE